MTQPLRSSVITAEDLYREVKLPLVDPSGRDAATVLGLGQTKARAMAKSGEIPTIRLGRRWWVSTAVLRRMLDMDAA
jgi:excisionase family DNA binding protein